MLWKTHLSVLVPLHLGIRECLPTHKLCNKTIQLFLFQLPISENMCFKKLLRFGSAFYVITSWEAEVMSWIIMRKEPPDWLAEDGIGLSSGSFSFKGTGCLDRVRREQWCFIFGVFWPKLLTISRDLCKKGRILYVTLKGKQLLALS